MGACETPRVTSEATFAIRAMAALAICVELPALKASELSGVFTPVLVVEAAGTRFAGESCSSEGV